MHLDSSKRRLSYVSLVLLLASYIWFGWYLCGLKASPTWLNAACYSVFGSPVQPSATTTQQPIKKESVLETTRSPDKPSPPKPETQEKPGAKESPAAKATQPSPAETRPVPAFTRAFCNVMVKYNLLAGVLAIAWIILSSLAFISPLTNFSTFITRWFHSDTIAFATVFLLAGLVTMMLYVLHVFMPILTILAVDGLARIDIQYAGLSGVQAFWILTLVSFIGLTIGWTAHALVLR